MIRKTKFLFCYGLLVSIAILFASYGFAMGKGNNVQSEQNKQHVIAFYNAVVNEKDFDTASQYIGDKYTQHNPLVADGIEGVKTFINFLRSNFPQAHNEIKQIFVDGDYVILHVHSIRIPGTRGRAIIDIFKLKDGKIIEHWDAIQDIPEKSANPNGMF